MDETKMDEAETDETQSADAIIPNIIHQVWIGGGPLTEEAERYHETWKEHHSDWEVILWDKAKVERELFPLHNQATYDAETSHAFRTDILRLELLLRFGGLYADMDMECLRPHDRLRTLPAFLGRVRLGHHETGEQFIETALMGAAPGHPFLAQAVRHLSAWAQAFDGYSFSARTGPQWIQKELYAYWKMQQFREEIGTSVERATEGGHGADAEHGPTGVAVLPRDYFFPWWVSDTAWTGLTDRTLSVHHWWGSWNNRAWKGDPVASLSEPEMRGRCLHFIDSLPEGEQPAFLAVLLETAARDVLSPNVFHQLAGLACIEESWRRHPRTRPLERRAIELRLLHAAASENVYVCEAAQRLLRQLPAGWSPIGRDDGEEMGALPPARARAGANA